MRDAILKSTEPRKTKELPYLVTHARRATNTKGDVTIMASSAFRKLRNVVLVDGARLPFNPSGSVYNKLVAYDLARLALSGILTKSGISPKAVDYVLMGTVIQEVRHRACAATLPRLAHVRARPAPCVRSRTRTLHATRGFLQASRRMFPRTQ